MTRHVTMMEVFLIAVCICVLTAIVVIVIVSVHRKNLKYMVKRNSDIVYAYNRGVNERNLKGDQLRVEGVLTEDEYLRDAYLAGRRGQDLSKHLHTQTTRGLKGYTRKLI